MRERLIIVFILLIILITTGCNENNNTGGNIEVAPIIQYEINSDNYIKVHGTLNVPSEMIFDLEIYDDTNNDISVLTDFIVKDGKYESQWIKDDSYGFRAGNYLVQLRSKELEKQPTSVLDKIGKNAEKLKGAYVVDDNLEGIKVKAFIHIDVPFNSQATTRAPVPLPKSESDGYSDYVERIHNDPRIGMSALELRKSDWGDPKEINKTTTKYGVSEQWVYSMDRYVYLEDGVVTVIQE